MQDVDGVAYSGKMVRSQNIIEKKSGNHRRQGLFLCVIAVSACVGRCILAVLLLFVL